MKKKTLSLSITALSIMSLVAFSACSTTVSTENGTSKPTGNTYDSGYMDGFNKAREMALNAGLPQQQVNTTVNGTVVSTSGSNMTLEVRGLLLDEKVDGVGVRRTVDVSRAEIVILEEVDPQEFQSQNDSFIAALSTTTPNSTPPVPPSPYREVSGSVADIQAGSQVTVQGNEGEDLTLLSEFSAAKVTVMPSFTGNVAAEETENTGDAMEGEVIMMEEDTSMMMEAEEVVQ